ncbi:MAG: hypothetical protein PHS79_04600 [Patescibacteria group bacterium]|nr:hypothetical protein [Patescibacteria group bacterium]
MTTFEPLQYTDPNASDEAKAQEAERFYRSNVACQILAEWFQFLAQFPTAWYPAEAQLKDWPINKRLHELADRPDARYKLMCAGFANDMPEKTTRNIPPTSQAEWLDKTRESGDKTAEQHVRMFKYSLSMCHTDPVMRFLQLSKRIDWADESPLTCSFILAFISSAMNDKRLYEGDDGYTETHSPVILHREFLAELDLIEYLKVVGLERQIEILKRRATAEANNQFFSIRQELTEIVTVSELCDKMPVRYFKPVFELIGKKLGLITEAVVEAQETSDVGEESAVINVTGEVDAPVGEMPESSPDSLPAVLQVTDVVATPLPNEGVATSEGNEIPKA